MSAPEPRWSPGSTIAERNADHARAAGVTVYPSGAQRHSDAEDVRFDLMPPAALLEIAKVWAEGAVSHGPDNWHKGMPYSVIVNHALKHLARWQSGDRSEPHLAKVAWGMMALLAFEAEGRSKELNDLPVWRHE